MSMLVSEPGDRTGALLEALRGLRQYGFKVATRLSARGKMEQYSGHIPYEIKVWGADHEGIVHKVTYYLASQGINIKTLNTNGRNAPIIDTLLFEMDVVVLLLGSLNYHGMHVALDEVGGQSGVNAEINPYTG